MYYTFSVEWQSCINFSIKFSHSQLLMSSFDGQWAWLASILFLFSICNQLNWMAGAGYSIVTILHLVLFFSAARNTIKNANLIRLNYSVWIEIVAYEIAPWWHIAAFSINLNLITFFCENIFTWKMAYHTKLSTSQREEHWMVLKANPIFSHQISYSVIKILAFLFRICDWSAVGWNLIFHKNLNSSITLSSSVLGNTINIRTYAKLMRKIMCFTLSQYE